jgi:hypothetical protein
VGQRGRAAGCRWQGGWAAAQRGGGAAGHRVVGLGSGAAGRREVGLGSRAAGHRGLGSGAEWRGTTAGRRAEQWSAGQGTVAEWGRRCRKAARRGRQYNGGGGATREAAARGEGSEAARGQQRAEREKKDYAKFGIRLMLCQIWHKPVPDTTWARASNSGIEAVGVCFVGVQIGTRVSHALGIRHGPTSLLSPPIATRNQFKYGRRLCRLRRCEALHDCYIPFLELKASDGTRPRDVSRRARPIAVQRLDDRTTDNQFIACAIKAATALASLSSEGSMTGLHIYPTQPMHRPHGQSRRRSLAFPKKGPSKS